MWHKFLNFYSRLIFFLFFIIAFSQNVFSAFEQEFFRYSFYFPQQISESFFFPPILAFQNPSLVGYSQKFQFSSSAQILYSDLQSKNFAGSLIIPTIKNRFGLGISYLQSSIPSYQESEWIISGSFRLHQFLFGSNLKLMKLQIDSMGSSQDFSVDSSVIFDPVENWNCSLIFKNLNRAKLGNTSESLPSGFIVRQDFHPKIISEKIFSALEYRKLSYQSGTFSFLFGYHLHPHFFINLGTDISPTQLYGGFSSQFKSLKLQYHIHYYPDLPLTHSVLSGVSF